MTAVTLSTRIPFVNADGTLTNEAYRALYEILNRTGGAMGLVGDEVFNSNSSISAEGTQSAGGDIAADVRGAAQFQSFGETTSQPLNESQMLEFTTQPDAMVMQPVSEQLFLDLPSFATTGAPAYKKGRMYFDTTMNKARIGGATAYETITSS